MARKLFFTAVLCLARLSAAVVPEGSELEVRLLHAVGSRVSHVGDLVQASMIAPALDHETILIPAHATVSGIVDGVDRLGLGFRHPAARLDLHFTQLHLLDGTVVPIDARLASVEEAREAVTDTGAVIGIHPGASFSTGVSGVFTLLLFGEPEFRLPVLSFKFLAARSPDAEITFPPGTEMLLRLNRDVHLKNPANCGRVVPLLATSQIDVLESILAKLPRQETSLDAKHASDLINILLVGSRLAVERTFRAAGWYDGGPHGVMALYQMYHCVVQRVGDKTAPMTRLLFGGHPADFSFQKSLDTLSRRHHIRLWREEQSDVWLGAATEDVKYKVRAFHITHGTARYIDNERAKVVNDLTFTGCVDSGALVPRASLKPAQEEADSILTDGNVAVLQLNTCTDPDMMPPDPQAPRPVRAIRAVLAVGEDIVRSNPVSAGYAMTKSIIETSHARATTRFGDSSAYKRPIAIWGSGDTCATRDLALR